MMCWSLDVHPRELELSRVARPRPDGDLQFIADVHCDPASTPSDPITTEQRVPVDGEVVIRVFPF